MRDGENADCPWIRDDVLAGDAPEDDTPDGPEEDGPEEDGPEEDGPAEDGPGEPCRRARRRRRQVFLVSRRHRILGPFSTHPQQAPLWGRSRVAGWGIGGVRWRFRVVEGGTEGILQPR